MTNSLTCATVAARPAALASPQPARKRRPRFASVTAAISALLSASARMDPADALMAQYAAASTADYVRMSLLSRSIDGDAWATSTLAAMHASRVASI